MQGRNHAPVAGETGKPEPGFCGWPEPGLTAASMTRPITATASVQPAYTKNQRSQRRRGR